MDGKNAMRGSTHSHLYSYMESHAVEAKGQVWAPVGHWSGEPGWNVRGHPPASVGGLQVVFVPAARVRYILCYPC